MIDQDDLSSFILSKVSEVNKKSMEQKFRYWIVDKNKVDRDCFDGLDKYLLDAVFQSLWSFSSTCLKENSLSVSGIKTTIDLVVNSFPMGTFNIATSNIGLAPKKVNSVFEKLFNHHLPSVQAWDQQMKSFTLDETTNPAKKMSLK